MRDTLNFLYITLMVKICLIADMHVTFDRRLAVSFMEEAGRRRDVTAFVVDSINCDAPEPGELITSFWHNGIPDVLLGTFRKPAWIDWASSLSCPVVNLSSNQDQWNGHAVLVDALEMGRTVARHFYTKGYRNMTFVSQVTPGPLDLQWGQGFQQEAEQLGAVCFSPLSRQLYSDPMEIEAELLSRPRPHAVLAATSRIGAAVVRMLEGAGVGVPADIAVATMDRDEFSVGLCGRTLTSVFSDTDALIREALNLALQLKAESAPPQTPSHIRVPPLEIVEEETTQILAVSDPLVLKALTRIHAQGKDWPSIEMLCRVAGCSRRVMETRFKKATGISVGAYVLEHKLRCAEKWVRDPHLHMEEIAERCGYSDRNAFHLAFKKRFGVAPMMYRHQQSRDR